MSCLLCTSKNQAEFPAEIMVHFSGTRNLDNPGIMLFPKLLVCLDCGFSRFTVTNSELPLLAASPPRHESLTLGI